MKTKFSKLYVSLAVFVFAIAGAFATNAMNLQKKSATTLVPGYIRTATQCQESVQCSTDPGQICTAPSGQQLFDYDGEECIMPLQKPAH